MELKISRIYFLKKLIKLNFIIVGDCFETCLLFIK